MNMQLLKALFVMAMFAVVAESRAVNDVLWMGFSYSVSIRYIDITSKEISPARPKSMQMPDYPMEMMNAALSGDVLVTFIVGKDGITHNVKVESASFPELGIAATKAVGLWSFMPGYIIKTGKTVASEMQCKFAFRASEAKQEVSPRISNKPGT